MTIYIEKSINCIIKFYIEYNSFIIDYDIIKLLLLLY